MREYRSSVVINLANYQYNISQIRKFMSPNQDLLQIIKADAYGHGAYQIARQAIKLGAKYLGVANYDEALQMRYKKINTPILILSPSLENEIKDIVAHDITPSVNTLDFAKKLDEMAKRYNKKLPIHVNIDSGMNRSGIKPQQVASFCSEILKLNNIYIEGFFTHFAESEANENFTNEQYNIFIKAVKASKIKAKYIHCANSCGVINFDFPEMNLVRIGILSFGIYPADIIKRKIDIKPVMKFMSKISQLKHAKKGESIGYNRLYKVDNEIVYAIIPVGYADGYNYFLGNRGFVSCRNRLLPILGKISMDMITVDVSELSDVEIGDEVVLFGNEQLHIEELTNTYQGSAYELATMTGKRARRIYFHDHDYLSDEPLLRRDFYSHDFSRKKLSQVIKSALNTRLDSSEISDLIYTQVINDFIKEADEKVSYRHNFKHNITFKDCGNPDLFEVHTTLSYRKKLRANSFMIACAKDESSLQDYLKNPEVEYRWILSESNLNKILKLNASDSFVINKVRVNNLSLSLSSTNKQGVIEYNCYHNELDSFIGQECEYYIETSTFYSKHKHQMSVFITEPTKGVEIKFFYPEDIIKGVETVSLLTNEVVDSRSGEIVVKTDNESWTLSNTAVIFSY